jgi:radical SAM superfamily enzyme YgiQ (UPF0313 family)
MQVVLISTYELGRQPFGLASPAAWLRARGHQVTCVDLSVSVLPSRPVCEAEFIAFYLPMHTATRLAAPLILKVRESNSTARLAAYGLYAPLNEAYLRSLGVQVIVGGEFESELASAMEGGAPKLVSLDRLRFVTPDRAGLPKLDRYAHLHRNGGRVAVGYTEASRGCKHLCRHCPVVPVYQGIFRVVQPEVVLADIRQQVAQGAGHITFGDPDFFNGPAHARKIVTALHEQWPELTYDVTVKVEHLLAHRDLLPVLKLTGCLWVTSAVESTEDPVLLNLDKRHTRADFLAALRVMREAGLLLSPTFVPFTPWTTLEGYRDLLHVLVQQDLVDTVAPIQLALRLLIPANSRLLELGELRNSLEPFVDSALLHRWHHPDSRVDALADRIFRIVAAGQKAGTPRRPLFARIWAESHDDKPLENFDLMPRATVPYLDEPWYC